MKKSIEENGIKYDVITTRQIWVQVVHSPVDRSESFCIGFQPESRRIDIERGGFEWFQVPKNGEAKPGPSVYHPFNCRLGIGHCQFYFTRGKWRMRELVQTEPKDDWRGAKSPK